MMNNYFTKFQEDILRAYKNINGDIAYKNVFSDFNKEASPLLLEMLKSYYFENKFNPKLNERNGQVSISFDEQVFRPFTEFGLYHNFKETKELNININDIKKELLNIDPIYSVIFEKDPLKQKANLLEKHEISYTIVKIEDDVYEGLKEFQNLFKSENPFGHNDSYQKSHNLEKELKTTYDISLISFDYNTNRHFVVAHNKDQIVGLTSLTNYSMFFNEDEDNHFMRHKFAYNSYVVVSSHFRGENIAVGMMKKAMDFAKENNLIFLRSSPTEDGKNYIEKKIDKIVENDQALVCINDSAKYVISSIKDIILSMSNEVDYLKFMNKLRPLAKKLNHDFSERYENLDKIDDYQERMKLIKIEDAKYQTDIDSFKENFAEKKKNKITYKM